MLSRWLVVASCVAALSAQTYRGRIGGEVESPVEGSRGRGFVDLGRGFRPWAPVSGSGTVPLDSNGWPLGDAQTVLFDIRPVPAWAPPIDDPAQFQPDWSGAYHVTFNGQAELKSFDVSAFTVTNVWYDATLNTTTADLVVAPGTGLVAVSFTNTKRTPASAPNTGITNLRVIRPGYPADTTQPFTREYLRSVAPFGLLRFMGFASTNDSNPAFTDPDNHVHWANRHVPSDATQQDIGRQYGVAWEYAILLANLTGKDMWINIPVAADDDYVAKLAALLHDTLRPDLNIYIEHSNEVWNPLFSQHSYNQAAAPRAAAHPDCEHLRRGVRREGYQHAYPHGVCVVDHLPGPIYAGAGMGKAYLRRAIAVFLRRRADALFQRFARGVHRRRAGCAGGDAGR